ncbi:MAG: methionine--tRNA ligase [Bdellovibrionales bacterium]|nr:methionine--tRNA ligase [Bdellovibrionales bacterium]
MSKRKILCTAALPYANGSIHIGHLVEYLQVDMWTRFQKMRGHECLYICADDTHGTPIMVKARDQGITPEALISRMREEHLKDFGDFWIEFDNFGSTNSPENKALAEEFFAGMKAKGAIAVRVVQQLYCDTDKMFLPDRFVKGTCPKCASPDQYGDSCDKCGSTYSPSDLKDVKCSLCARPPSLKQSEHLFFQLNQFKEFLKTWVQEHTSKEISNKLNEWLSEDLRDWDISRDEPYFGFEIPGHPKKYFYVWVDAPIGYIASTEEWCKKNSRKIDDFWKNPDTEIYHFIGKDIVYFHTLFWPAMLKCTGYQLPRRVNVHGHLIVNGEKMSKSKGTFISARTYLEHLDPIFLRYYYACKLSSQLADLDLNLTDFAQRVNSDLVGKITNLGSRSMQMLGKRFAGQLVEPQAEHKKMLAMVQSKAEEIATHYENLDFSKVITEIRDLADLTNEFFDKESPWKIPPDQDARAQSILSVVANVFRVLAIYLTPVIPRYSEKVAVLFNEKQFTWDALKTSKFSGKLNEFSHLAQRVDSKQIEAMVQSSLPKTPAASESTPNKASANAAPAAAAPQGTAAPADSQYASIDDFGKIDLRVARIVEAGLVEGADKLLKLKVSMGELGARQIFAGIRSAYDPKTLEGRLVAVVANLKPRQMKFGLSEGMVLAAGAGGKDLFVLSPDSGAKEGDRIK